MRPFLENLLQVIRARWNKFSPQAKTRIGIGAGALVVVGLVTSAILQQDPYRVLYTDLHPDESRLAAKKLGEIKIPYQTQDDGKTLSVPRSRVELARMELAKEGIPGQDVVGFEKFDGSTLGMSSYVQRIQYLRAVQGELVRSIERLTSVKHARVHISLPPKKTFLEDEEPPKASVILELVRGKKPDKQETAGIAHLVASAVEGLNVNQVTIVDTRGEFLHRPGDDQASDKPTALLDHQRSIEREYEKRVEEILVPLVGLGKVHAKVTAELDPSRVNMTEESFDPEKTAVKTTVKNEETTSGSRPNPIGIPGSRSNLPGAEVQNPPLPVAQANTEKVTTNSTYAVPRKVTVTNKPSGSIKRLTVAVVVDGHYAEGGTAGAQFSPRTPEELQKLKELVTNAIGFDEGRRDSLTITSMAFAVSDLEPEQPVVKTWWTEQAPWVRYGILAASGVLLLLLILFVRRAMLKAAAKKEEAEPIPSLPKTVAEIEAGIEKNVIAFPNLASAVEETEPLEKKEEEELKTRIFEKLTQSQKKGIRIIQDWIEEAAPSETAKSAA